MFGYAIYDVPWSFKRVIILAVSDAYEKLTQVKDINYYTLLVPGLLIWTMHEQLLQMKIYSSYVFLTELQI